MTHTDQETSVRQYASMLARTHPGKNVELRIPPWTAVQLGVESTTHTHRRGTPGSVVEMDPTTFLRLIHGDLTWGEALSSHLVDVSGVHANLSHMFPAPLSA
ncbi:MAG: sterol carrier family protein [Propionibacteriaceae bacterium]|nr:sterol carrier family protein [Propionibacteriaceae bacterium]